MNNYLKDEYICSLINGNIKLSINERKSKELFKALLPDTKSQKSILSINTYRIAATLHYYWDCGRNNALPKLQNTGFRVFSQLPEVSVESVLEHPSSIEGFSKFEEIKDWEYERNRIL